MIKSLKLILTGLALSACQTMDLRPGPGDIDVFEIPAENSRIVLPEGYVADRVEVSIDGSITDELVSFEASSIRYKTAPEGLLAPTTKDEFKSVIDKVLQGYNATYQVPATALEPLYMGPGHYAVTEDALELCFFAIISSGRPELIKGRTLYPGKIIVTVCEKGQTMATHPKFSAYALQFLRSIVIRDTKAGISNTAN